MPTKEEVRARRLAFRRSLRATPEHKAALDKAVARNAVRYLSEVVRDGVSAGNIAAYVPLPTEPGSEALLPALRQTNRTVFLPVTLPEGQLAWTAGQDPALFTSAVLRSCAAILAPAMAVDRRGVRMGKGGGYYDRALAGLTVPVAALVYDEDLLPHLPREPHDVPVHAAITPSGIITF